MRRLVLPIGLALLSAAALAQTATPTRTPTPINIGNFVWDDLDQDGRQDAGEPGLSGVTVQLWNSTKTQLLDSAVTSGTGSYTVTAPVPGNYRVRVLLPGAMDQFSPKDQAGGDDLLDSDINPSGVDFGFTDVFNLASNVISITRIDAGIIKFRTPTPTRTPTPINVGNFVWHDVNGNGVQNPGEPGVPNVTVQIWNSAKTFLFDSAVTNASGGYSMQVAGPGQYRVRVVLPGGASFTVKDSGPDDILDSDINPIGVNAGFTDIYVFASNLISITSIDAGLLNPPPTPTATATATPTPTAVPTPTGTPTLPITSLAPDNGPTSGGTVFSVLGSGFQAGATVHIGGQPATSETWFGDNRVDAISPPGLAAGGLHTLILENPPGGGFGAKPAGWLSDFLDVSQAHIFHDFVEKLVRRSVTAGCGAGNYCPDQPVTREQMAVFLLRSKDGPTYVPPACAAPMFADVPCASPFAAWINELAARSITSGCGGGNYCPGTAVTREQMAVLLLRTQEGPVYTPPPCAVPSFADVACASPYAAWIEELVTRGVTAGCGGGNYCPGSDVTRGQMSVFLSVTFGLP